MYTIRPNKCWNDLKEIRKVLAEQHDNLFAEELDRFMIKVEIFGFHFACLDIRQDSRKHESLVEEIIEKKAGKEALKNYQSCGIVEKMNYLATFQLDH